MQIITKAEEATIAASMLDYGDTFKSASGKICMVVEGGSYFEDIEDNFTVITVNLREGTIERFRPDTVVRPIKLVATEE